jgi:hypothetical protein
VASVGLPNKRLYERFLWIWFPSKKYSARIWKWTSRHMLVNFQLQYKSFRHAQNVLLTCAKWTFAPIQNEVWQKQISDMFTVNFPMFKVNINKKKKFPTCFVNFLEVNLWCSLSELMSPVFSWWGFPTVNLANKFCETIAWQIELANKIEVNYSFSSISVYHQWYFFTQFFVNFQVHRNWIPLQKKTNFLNWVNFIDRS